MKLYGNDVNLKFGKNMCPSNLQTVYCEAIQASDMWKTDHEI